MLAFPATHILHEPPEVYYNGRARMQHRSEVLAVTSVAACPQWPLSIRPCITASIRCDIRNSKDRHSALAPSSQGYGHLLDFVPTSASCDMLHPRDQRKVPLALIFLDQRNVPHFKVDQHPLLAKAAVCTSRARIVASRHPVAAVPFRFKEALAFSE